MIRIKSSKGYFQSISLLQVIIVSIFFLGVVNSFPSPKKGEESSDSEDWSDVAPKKKPALDAATKKILAQARSVTKPKGYAKVLKEAKKHDKNPEIINEVNELGEANAHAVASGRGYTNDPKKLWKYQMYVFIDKAYTRKQQQDVQSAIYTLKEAMKCFDFKISDKVLPNNVDHLHIKPQDPSMSGASCASYLGRVGGKQITVVGERCVNIFGVTMHEVMHVLGFYHEHVRKDRDKFVKVNWDHLQDPQWAAQYEIRNDQIAVQNYDFDSIMQYPFNSAMTNIVPLPRGVTAGQRSHLSTTDIQRLKKAYPCK